MVTTGDGFFASVFLLSGAKNGKTRTVAPEKERIWIQLFKSVRSLDDPETVHVKQANET